MGNLLAKRFPALGKSLPLVELTDLPSPVEHASVDFSGRRTAIWIKRDDASAEPYGGNKVRKLEYLLGRARQRSRQRVATFGAVGSNHAVATAIFARQTGFACTCFLSHQSLKPGLGRALYVHQAVGTEIVAYGGDRRKRIATLREHLHGRNAWVIPLGGSSWLGAVGFVNAGLEVAAQVAAGELEQPRRIYVALGTMGSAAGLALGLALAKLDTTVVGVRVTDELYASENATVALMQKTARLMHHCDDSLPPDLARRARFECRGEFLGDGYGRSNPETERAIATARDALGLELESTYTGKAMAALLADIAQDVPGPLMFWNTYNSRPLTIGRAAAPDYDVVPREFSRYFD